MALGQIGLQIEYYYSLTQREFTNLVNGYFKKQDYLSRERWVIARKMMHAFVAPYSKGIKETDLLQFPWEQKMIAELTIEEAQKMEEDVERIKRFYESWDNKQAKA